MGLLDRFIQNTSDIPMIGALVIQDGQELARHHWESESRINQYSISKTFTSAAVGMAVDEGLLELDVPVKTYLDQYWPAEEDIDERTSLYLEKLTLRHLITMTIGHHEAGLMATRRLGLKNVDWVTYGLSRPIAYEPGEVFVYNNIGPYLAGVAVQEVTGMSQVDYLMPRLFEPLGILRPTWEVDPMNRQFGSSGLMLSLSEIARFGQLYLQGGVWNGKRLISEMWIKEATTNQIVDETRRYGLGFWLGPDDAFRSDGKYGQYIITIPSKKAVIAVNAFNRGEKNIRTIIEEDIYPIL